MKVPRMAGCLTLLIFVVVMSYYLVLPLYREVESRLQRAVVHSDDPASELDFMHQNSSRSETEHGHDVSITGEFSSDITDSQHVGNSSTNGTVVKSGSLEQNPNGNSDTKAGRVSSHESGRPLHKDLKRTIWDAPRAGSVMPPLKDFALSKEMVEFRAKKNVIVVTFANHAFLDFVRTWVNSLTDAGVTNILVGAMDTQMLEALYWAGIPTFDMGSNVLAIDAGWGTAAFHKMGREKVILVNAFLALEYELLMCDADMVWLRNPLPFIERFPEADVLTSSDGLVNTVNDERLEVWEASPGVYNIGINHYRPTAIAKKFAAEWMAALLANEEIWDQNGFNDLMLSSKGPSVDNSSGLFYAYDKTLKLGILPVSIFCSGHTYYVQKLYKELGLQPYVIHTTFQFAGTDGKRHRLREAKAFYDPPEYYDVPGGFLSYTPSLPEKLMKGEGNTVESHFNLVNHQLVQVRSALAIASILNRTLVMPELWCWFERMWYGHPGILPGTNTKQPFLCPMDHIFEVDVMLTDMLDEEFGPLIRFREYSFFDNPRLPAKVNASILKVELCELGTPGCNREPSKAPVLGALQLPMNSTEDQLRVALSPYTEASVIEFSSMLGALGSFSDEVRGARFANRVKKYTGIYCCVQDFIPGHIWYDIYWDKKPGWKPKPPHSQQEDHQPF